MRKPRLVLAAWTLLGCTWVLADQAGGPEALLIQQGYYWQAKEHPERAAEAWNKLLNLAPEQPDALYGLGLISLQRKRMAEAQAYLTRLQALTPMPRQALQLQQDIALSPQSQQQLLEQARELSDAEQRDEAVQVYRQLLGGRQPQGLIAREYYNTLGFASGGWPAARVGLERLQRERPDDSILALFLALHLARNPDSRPEGIRALARLSHNPDIGGNADQTWRFALQWLGPPSRDQVSLFRQYLEAHPDDQEIRNLMNKGIAQGRSGSGWRRDPQVARGLQALDNGDLAGAEQAFQARLLVQPNDYDALGGMGILRQQQKRLDEAQDYLQRATQAPGGGQWRSALEDVRYWRLLARAEQEQRAGRYTEARAAIDQALARNPLEPAGPTALAGLQARMGQRREAEAGYREVLARKPDYPDALGGLVNLLSQAGRAEEALRLIDGLGPAQQARLAPSVHIRALRATQVAKLAERRGDLAGARKAYQQALADDPDNAWTRFALARVLLRSGQAQAARDLMEQALKRQPGQADALYASTLLSAELGEWRKARRSLEQVPAGRRSDDMNELDLDIRLHIQTEQAVDMARRGQRQEAWALLDDSAPLTRDKPTRVAVLAAAYAEAGDPQHGISLMRQLLERSPATDAQSQLLYAGVLLKAGQDAEAGDILRHWQDQPMDEDSRQQHADLLYLYRVRQADALRERNDLVAAYDVLSPALAERPAAAPGVTSLAQMYAASGNPEKARQLYAPLLQGDPRNARLHLGLADIALKGRDRGTAEKSVARALELEPEDPQVLTQGARIYRRLGNSAEASRLLRKAVAIEDSQRTERLVLRPAARPRPFNPFVGLPGQRREATTLASAELVPPAVPQGRRRHPGPDSGLPPLVDPGQGRGVADSAGQVDPYARDDDTQGPEPAWADSPSPARRELDQLAAESTGYAVQGLTVRANNSEKGLGRLLDIEAPFELSLPLVDSSASLALRVTPVTLYAGSPKGDAAARFGTSTLAPVGSQKDSGVGFALAYQDRDLGLKADAGVSPLGFTYSTAIGGISLNRPFAADPDYRYGVSLSRRPVIDSLTSFAGSRDPRSGKRWGGVTANGVRGELSYDDQRMGAYGYASAHKLLGNNVESNDRLELGSGIYWYLQNAEDRILTLGLSGSALRYGENQGFYTYGHGGYFSPQTFFALGVPVSWAQRTERFTYRLRGSLGVQHIGQDGAPIFPGHRDLQGNADAVGLSRYSGSSKTGLGYSLNAAGEYKFGSRFFLGASLGLDNASDYRQFAAGLYLRYTFEDMTGPMSLPVSPFGSPYSNSY